MQVLHTIQSAKNYLHSQLIHQIVQSTNTRGEEGIK